MTKQPPVTSKRALPILYLFKTLLPTKKKKCTTTKEPTKWPTFLFIQNASLLRKKKRYQIVHLFKTPLLLQNKQLLPQEAHKMTSFCIYWKRPDPPR